MNYKYIVVFKMPGMLAPVDESQLAWASGSAKSVSWRLTRDADSLPHALDVYNAQVALSPLSGRNWKDIPEADRLDTAISESKDRRRKQMRGCAVLVIEASGKAPNFETKMHREFSDHSVVIPESNDGFIAIRDAVREKHAPMIDGALVTLALSSDSVREAQRIVSSVLFFDSEQRQVIVRAGMFSARLYAGVLLPPALKNTSSWTARRLGTDGSLLSISRLHARSLQQGGDPAISFLSAWAGLEVLSLKHGGTYERVLVNRVASRAAGSVPNSFVEDLHKVASKGRRLTESFSAMAFVLDERSAASDLKTFQRIKSQRDQFYHGERIALASLPFDDARELLSKYLRLHLDYVGRAASRKKQEGSER